MKYRLFLHGLSIVAAVCMLIAAFAYRGQIHAPATPAASPPVPELQQREKRDAVDRKAEQDPQLLVDMASPLTEQKERLARLQSRF